MSYNIIKNDNNFSSHYIKNVFTPAQKAERLKQLNHIKKWARRHKQDPREVLYFYTYNEILQREAYEKMIKDYYLNHPYLNHRDDDDDDYY